MKLTEWSVKNSLLVNLLTVFIIIAGLLALFNLRREAFPNISFDVVQILTTYPGASPSQIEKLITIPLEKELKEVDDIKEMNSASTEGVSVIFLQLEPDIENKDRIINDIQRAVDKAEDLPSDLENKPQVEELSTKNSPLLEVSLYGNISPFELRKQARLLETALLDDRNVAKVIRRGYRELEISVEVDPQKLKDWHVSLLEVMTALQQKNINLPGGDVLENNQEYLLRVSGEFYTPEQIAEVSIRGGESGRQVKIKDVAQVKENLKEIKTTNRTDGKDSINLLVLKKEKADILDLVEDIKVIVEDFKKVAPAGLEAVIINDFSYYVERRLDVLINNGVLGLLLLTVPLLLFLSFRTALSAAIGIPTAFMSAILMMYYFGITINLMSLFGMIMVLGMLVDEDIVIAENVHRLLEEGRPPLEAAIEGTKQVARSIVATVLTTITAFAPLLMMTGIMGKFVQQIPQVVIVTLVASLVQALIILPSHIHDLNKKTNKELKTEFKQHLFQRLLTRLANFYEKVIRVLVNRRYVTSFLFLLFLVFSLVWGAKNIPFILFPAKGIEQFFIRVEADMGTPVTLTTEHMQEVEKIIATLPKNELDHYVTQGGLTQNESNDPLTERGSHIGQVWVFLTPEKARARDADAIMEDLRPKIEAVKSFKRVYFEPVNTGPPVGKPVAVKIIGDQFEELDKVADQYFAYLSKLPGVKDLKKDYEPGKSELRAKIDEKKLAQAGLTYDQVAKTLRIAFEGGVATTIKESDEETDVVVRFPEALRNEPKNLDSLFISNAQGDQIPLSQIARFEKTQALSIIKHFDRKRLISVSANVDEKITTSSEVNEKIKKEFNEKMKTLPGISVRYGGEDQDTQESMQSLKQAFILAIFLTFIIIAATFKSLLEPFVIMSTIPMGILAVIWGFYFSGEALTFLSMLGIIGFVGVIVDGAILIIEFIHYEKEKGLSGMEAIIMGAKARFRPIVLTTATTVLGILPSAFGIGGVDPFIQPMALSMNWGLGGGTILVVLLIPVFLAILQDMKNWRKKEV